MPHQLSRRNFLLQASAFLAASALQSNVSAGSILSGSLFSGGTNDDVLLGGCRFKDLDKNTIKFSLARIVPAQSAAKQASADFFPHGLAFTGGQKKKAFAFEKIGKGAGLFDLEKMELLTSIPPVKGRLFYGHGACSADDQLIYSTETAETGDGAIGVRETGSLKYLGDFPTYGQNPHECHLIENGTVLAVTNGGGNQASGQLASICYIDVQSQKLLDRIEMTDQRFNAGHMFPLANRQSILVSAQRRDLDDNHIGAVSMQRDSKKLDVITQPADVVNNMLGESLSVLAIPAADLFIVTHPKPGMVTVWQLSTNKLLKRLDLPHARGLALTRDNSGVWISYDTQAKLVRMALNNFSLGTPVSDTFITGSHLFPV